MITAEILTENMSHDEIQKRMDWCTEQFGRGSQFRDTIDEDRPWLCMDAGLYVGYWWYFAREEYATLFALRWL